MGSPVEVAHAKVFRKLSEINPLAPAEALTFLDERHDTINDASFAMQWRFVAEVPELWELRDKPSAMHSQGGNVAFADGHVTLQRWQDARTRKAPRDDLVMPNNFDVRWLQEHATWREPSIRKL
jgi:prepilin-type processing-associated H-X9-DG protein